MTRPLILCIDDGKLSLVLRKVLLEHAGYDVITATESEQALTFISERNIDLVICDHLLHGAEGARLATQIKFLKPDLSIILFSGRVELVDEPEDVDVLVSKLDGPQVLLASVAKLLRLSSGQNCLNPVDTSEPGAVRPEPFYVRRLRAYSPHTRVKKGLQIVQN